MFQKKMTIAKALAKLLKMEEAIIESQLGPCKRPEHGDLAFPCFQAAKEAGKAPHLVAKELEESLGQLSFAKVIAVGPFLNFKFDESDIARSVLTEIMNQKTCGASDKGSGQTIVIDYSSPNIAKPFGIGHLRSTIIGASLKRLYQSQGYQVIGINHLGDWGTQFGLMMTAWKRHKPEVKEDTDLVQLFYDLYVQVNKEAKEDESIQNEGREWFRRLESGDEEAHKLWRFFRDSSLAEFKRVYAMLGVDFESWDGESFFNDKMTPIIDKLKAKGLTRKSEGALIIDLDEAMPEGHGLGKVLLQRDDGATLYMTRDLAAAYYRIETYKPSKVLYVVGHPQRQHFQQLFKILELMGEPLASCFEHVAFGHYLGMSTRGGTLVFLNEVMEKTTAMARDIAEGLRTREQIELSPDEIQEVAIQVGLGAVIFFDFHSRRVKDLDFEWERVLNLKGDSGPYAQWTHARCCGILRKHGRPTSLDVDFSLLRGEEARELFKVLGRLNSEIERALNESEPSVIASYIIDLAHAANAYIHVSDVIHSEDPLRDARALVIDATRKVLAQALEFLGVKALQKM